MAEPADEAHYERDDEDPGCHQRDCHPDATEGRAADLKSHRLAEWCSVWRGKRRVHLEPARPLHLDGHAERDLLPGWNRLVLEGLRAEANDVVDRLDADLHGDWNGQ